MNGRGPEREQPLPLEARPIQGVAAIIIPQLTDLIYTVVERENRPEYGKRAGDRTIPMETIEGVQTEEQTLVQLFEQEVYENLTIMGTEPIGYYGLCNIVGVRLFRVHVERNGLTNNGNGYNHNVRRHEVTDPRWMKPEDLLLERVRMGVPEMIEDYFLGRRGVRRECKPVPLLNSPNGVQGLK